MPGLWKLEDRCYEAHVRMPNAKFMVKTYRCGEDEAIGKFDSWVEAEGLGPRCGGMPGTASTTAREP